MSAPAWLDRPTLWAIAVGLGGFGGIALSYLIEWRLRRAERRKETE
jgi:hypothetical protein